MLSEGQAVAHSDRWLIFVDFLSLPLAGPLTLPQLLPGSVVPAARTAVWLTHCLSVPTRVWAPWTKGLDIFCTAVFSTSKSVSNAGWVGEKKIKIKEVYPTHGLHSISTYCIDDWINSYIQKIFSALFLRKASRLLPRYLIHFLYLGLASYKNKNNITDLACIFTQVSTYTHCIVSYSSYLLLVPTASVQRSTL